MSTATAILQEAATSEWSPSEKIQNLYRDHSASVPGLGAERAIHYTEFFKRRAGNFPDPSIRMARALQDHLQRRSLRIYPGELIVGTHTEHRIGAICHAELAGSVMLEDLFRFAKRKTNPLRIEPAARRRLLLNVMPYWLLRNLTMRAFPFRERMKYLKDQLGAVFFIINEAGGIAHFLPDYRDLIESGTDGLRERIVSRLEDGNLDADQENHLKAMMIALEAVEHFADRYKDLAREEGRDDLAEILERVPRRPAGTLREALQSIWFFQMVIQIESLDQGISLGRIDQYLYSLYEKEKEAGVFNEDEFKDLFCAFCIKLSEVIPLFSGRITDYFGGLPSGQALTLGGAAADGTCAANELTMMMLDVLDKFKTRQPNWHARVGSESRAAYFKKCVEVLARGGGSPALYNDDVIIPALSRRDMPADSVWNYGTVGCVEPAPSGISFTSSDAALFNLPVALEIVLGEGSRLNGVFKQKIGKQRTPLSKIVTFDDLLREVSVEMDHRLDHLKTCLDSIERANARYHPTPFSSLTVQGCIESARDLSRGGALTNASGIQGVGLADLANSLAAIDELVFRQQKFTLKEIAAACRDNFKNDHILQSKLRHIAKFGNDKGSVDEIAGRCVEMFDRLVSARTNTRGGRWMPGFYSMTCHRAFGSLMPALPSGRAAGQALADGLAPEDGSDVLGPTASLNSVLRLDHKIFGNGMNLNVKFDAGTIKGWHGRFLLESLLKGYFDQGGMQVQVNVLDPAVLEDAMRNPDRHRNLLVRISGYCAYFVDLTPAMQREIIDRTLQTV